MIPCKIGEDSERGSTKCTKCDAGEAGTGKDGMCTACGVGRYRNASMSAANCSICPAGWSLVGYSLLDTKIEKL